MEVMSHYGLLPPTVVLAGRPPPTNRLAPTRRKSHLTSLPLQVIESIGHVGTEVHIHYLYREHILCTCSLYLLL